MLFRSRISFRLYPKHQVVALYYSKLLDKYLSIPFGPGGNLNLGESVVYDTLEEACWSGYEAKGMKKKGNKMVPNCVPVKETLGSSATRYTERPTYEHFKENVERLRNEGIADVADTVADVVVPYYSAGKKLYKGDYAGAAKSAAVDTALMAAGGPLVRSAAKGLKLGGGVIRKGLSKLTGKGEKAVARDASAMSKSSKTPTPKPAETPAAPKTSSPIKSAGRAAAIGAGVELSTDAIKSSSSSDYSRDTSIKGLKEPAHGGKAYSSWETAPDKDPVYASKYKQSALKENKITDIRTMVKEGVENMDLSINGRSVTLNTSMAKRILEVYDSVNTKNKKIVEGMLNEDLESFKKLLNFSIRN